MKLKKSYNLVNAAGSKIINTEYIDGFQYSTPNTEPIRKALEEKDDTTVSATKAGNEEAFLPLEERAVVVDPGNPQADIMVLSFFPTTEGYYDYENFRYIYQYKDHLGNVRVSYVKNSAGSLQVMDSNDYYPFGLSFMKPFGQSSMYDPMAIPYNYKYNGKELQETGMYDYGARFYMPDLGRWFSVDPLAEKYPSWSPYNYAFNNPINFVDPDGREGLGWIEQSSLTGGKSYTYNPNVNTVAEAEAAGYSGVSNVYQSATIRGSNSFAGVEINHYSYSLNGDGTVLDTNGKFVGGNFATDAGTLVGNVQRADVPGGYYDGPIQYVGGAGDVTGIFEVGGMALAANSDGNANYLLAALLVTRSGNTGALKALSAEKGVLQNTFESQVDDLIKLNGGKNSVNINTTGGALHYDLRGATHKGVETPHVQRSFLNTNSSGQTFLNKDRKWVQPINQQDLRIIRNHLNKK